MDLFFQHRELSIICYCHVVKKYIRAQYSIFGDIFLVLAHFQILAALFKWLVSSLIVFQHFFIKGVARTQCEDVD